MNKLQTIQSTLKAPKGQFNSFGKYKYRSCEDILEALKPVLSENECHLIITDTIKLVGTRYYIEATCKLYTGGKIIAKSSALAREPEDKKGMDSSQITGTASSYARKYALNGMFLIDDTKDADTDEHHNQSKKPAAKKPIPKGEYSPAEKATVKLTAKVKSPIQEFISKLNTVESVLTEEESYFERMKGQLTAMQEDTVRGLFLNRIAELKEKPLEDSIPQF